MAKKPDPRQPSLFDAAIDTGPQPGSMNFGAQLRSALAKAIKECPQSRAWVAARMNDLIYGELAGEDGEVTVHMVNKWTAPASEAWRFPLEFLPAFAEATAAHWLVDQVAAWCGCRALLGKEAALADLGAMSKKGEDLRRKEDELRRSVDLSAAERLLQRRGGRQ